MTTQHTPGPWTYNLTTGAVRSLAEDFSNCRQPVICDLRHWPHEDTTYIHPANARLIAAAPDLLEALKNIVVQYNIVHGIGDMEMQSAIDFANNAIAKATGDTL